MSDVKRQQIICFVTVWLAYCVTYFVRKPLGVIKGSLGTEFSVTKTSLGWCDTALILPYAVFQIGLPGLSDRYGARRVLVSCLLLSGLACWLTGRVSNIASVNATLFVTGAALAPCWPACSKLLNAWFPDNRLNSVFGFINTATYSGGLGGTALAAAIQEEWGWRSVFVVPATMALLTAVLVGVVLKTPQEKGLTVPGKKEEEVVVTESSSSSSSFRTLFSIPCVVEVSSGVFCLKFVRYCMYMWLPLYLLEHLGYSKLQAGVFSTVFDIGGIVGSPLLGLVLERYCPARPLYGVYVTMLAAATSAALFIITATWGAVFNGFFLLAVGAAICGPDSILAGSVTMEIGERNGRNAGSGVTSLVNGVGSLGGIIEGPLVGVLWNLVGWGGVLSTVVGVTAIGTVFIFRAYQLDKSIRAKSTLPT